MMVPGGAIERRPRAPLGPQNTFIPFAMGPEGLSVFGNRTGETKTVPLPNGASVLPKVIGGRSGGSGSSSGYEGLKNPAVGRVIAARAALQKAKSTGQGQAEAEQNFNAASSALISFLPSHRAKTFVQQVITTLPSRPDLATKSVPELMQMVKDGVPMTPQEAEAIADTLPVLLGRYK